MNLFTFFSNEVEDGTDDNLPILSYKDTFGTIRQFNRIIQHNIVIRKTFLIPHGEDIKVICAQVKAWASHFYQDQEMFLVILGEVQATDIMTYDAISKGLDMKLQHESEIKDKGQFLSFWDITDHRLIKGSNSSYEVLVNWEHGSVTWETMSLVRRHDPIYLSKYAHGNYLVDKPGWKQLRRYVKNTKKMNRLLKVSKAKQIRNILNIKFGVNIPRDHKEVMMFDDDNGNNNWKDAEILKLKQIYNFDTFNPLVLSARHVSFLVALKSNYILSTTTNKMGGIRHAWWPLLI